MHTIDPIHCVQSFSMWCDVTHIVRMVPGSPKLSFSGLEYADEICGFFSYKNSNVAYINNPFTLTFKTLKHDYTAL